ncbi:BTB/POZ domain-containing adapter for CUL3-mediated RhoA degradation protein 3 [Octopus bimaculoides]|uniref:BTB domain-containing protein n=1 Tax=Octopus bimaculoides TaxID=37653 RepID=A0A0L8HTG3_OCTBM|nr:BTB/POZ domain-containing adapter for CUL3-mediated RhoA degradation protein 3 [Octopus bimaculoides]|eukprot:XP_014769568.1 PREDICTED: BTB/POZ domain-containing adapter for CUL3-mediated RhoA degradation protein 3-like [Octopus bimaculoides]
MSGEQLTKISGEPSNYVKLNIGGTLHYTTIGTLTKHNNRLQSMFSGKTEVVRDSDGFVIIERNGKYFETILNFLRDGSVPLPESKAELTELHAEAKYYMIQELQNIIETALKKKKIQLKCVVPLLTSAEEEHLLFISSRKPVIKLSCNRHNNKYSYTTNSDDNFLKNLELFDKLSLQFGGRLLLIKDVFGTAEICCWYFYGHSQKIAEVCCTSIVYGTDKKNTKVEYPKARIFEETLNVLLYENFDKGPDAELMKVTRGGIAALGGGYHSDEDPEDRLERADRLRRK